MLSLHTTTKFEKDYALMKKRGADMTLLQQTETELVLVRTGTHSDLF